MREGVEHMLLVTPRFGTISPWSSKATDIATMCALDKVCTRDFPHMGEFVNLQVLTGTLSGCPD
jgi:phosphoribosylformylglycinamidine synthase